MFFSELYSVVRPSVFSDRTQLYTCSYGVQHQGPSQSFQVVGKPVNLAESDKTILQFLSA